MTKIRGADSPARGKFNVLLDYDGDVVVRYVYDAWGNHAVLGTDGNDITDPNNIGILNPFRYRGYYYDTETGLYYLKTRYYDPEVGRFITIDGVSYLDPETINGLNLYAYCGNNPVMNVDPTGEIFFLFALLIGVVAGALVGGAVGGISAAIKGQSFWGGFLSGALVGGAIGGALVLGGATMLAITGKAIAGFVVASTVTAKLGLVGGTLIGSFIASAGAGMGAYAINENMNGRKIQWPEMIRQGLMTGLKGIISFCTGMILAATGSFNYLIKGFTQTFLDKIQSTIVRSIVSTLLQMPWRMSLR